MGRKTRNRPIHMHSTNFLKKKGTEFIQWWKDRFFNKWKRKDKTKQKKKKLRPVFIKDLFIIILLLIISSLFSLQTLRNWVLSFSNPVTWSSNKYLGQLWCKQPTHWKIPWYWEVLKAEGQRVTENERVGWHHWFSEHYLLKTAEIV